MFAEMLGIVCHSEYYSQCDQNVLSFLSLSLISLCFSNPRSRLLSSTLWDFALQYTGPISLLINLRTIHTIGIDKFSATTRIELQHTPSYDLLDPISRTTFLKDFIALIRFLAAGYGNVGHLRLPGTKIHRGLTSYNEMKEESGSKWMVSEDMKDESWEKKYKEEYYESWNAICWSLIRIKFDKNF